VRSCESRLVPHTRIKLTERVHPSHPVRAYNVIIDSPNDVLLEIQNEEMAMKRAGVVVALVLILSLPARGQRNYPKGEVFGGYAFSHNTADTIGRNLNGWGVGVSGNFTRYFGLAADFSGVYGSEPPFPQVGSAQPGISSDPVSVGAYHFLAGPRFTLRTHTVAPFAHAMFGLKDLRQELAGNWLTFGMGFGGGHGRPFGKARSVSHLPGRLPPCETALGPRRVGFRLPPANRFRFQVRRQVTSSRPRPRVCSRPLRQGFTLSRSLR